MLSQLPFLFILSLASAQKPFPTPNPIVDQGPPGPRQPERYGPKLAPILPINFPDPAIYRYGGQTYLFSSSSSLKKDKNNKTDIQIASAPASGQPVTKLADSIILPRLPSWVHPNHPRLLAPDIIRLPTASGNTSAGAAGGSASEGDFILYYTAPLASDPKKHCIGAARAPSITGPFTPMGEQPTICDIQQAGNVDAAPLYDDKTGKMYIVYKVDMKAPNSHVPNGGCGIVNQRQRQQWGKTPIMLQEVSPKDGITKVGEPVTILTSELEDGGYVEAPSIGRTGTGMWVMTFSSHCYRSKAYDLKYATSENLVQGFVRRGQLLKTGDFGLEGPGSASLTDGVTRIVFNAMTNGTAAIRQMYSLGLRFNGTKVEVVPGTGDSVGTAS